MARSLIIFSMLGAAILQSCGGGGASQVVTPPPPTPPPPSSSTPIIISIEPALVAVGSGGFDLTVNGSGYGSNSVVRWNGSNRGTTFVNSGKLTTAIPSSDLTMPEIVQITVSNGGSLVSNSLPFEVEEKPAPGTGNVQLISVALDGGPADGDSFSVPEITPDGRFVAFQSNATNLVYGPASGFSDIYVRDTCTGAPSGCVPSTVRVSVATDGTLANGNSRTPSISADGRYVAFDSSATNLISNDTNGTINGVSGEADVFVRDTCLGASASCTPATVRVSLAIDGSQSNGDSVEASVDGSGRFVAFSSSGTNLVAGDSTTFADVFIRDTCAGVTSGCTPSTTIASLSTSGTQGNQPSGRPAATPDMRYIVFRSFATNLVSGDTNNAVDDFVRDTCIGPTGCSPSTIRATVANDGTQANDRDDLDPRISADGRFVAFTSHATNLVSGDTNGLADVFVRDTCAGVASGCTPSTTRVSVSASGAQANSGSEMPSISASGRLIAFSSLASNLIPGGSSSPKTIFIRDTCFGAPSGCVPTTVLVPRGPDGSQDNGVSEFPTLSGDGHWVVFLSNATNLVAGATSGRGQTYIAKTGF
jgi:Tol biopolymer transport system component